MKLFIREHILLVIVQLFQMILLVGLLALANFHEFKFIFYLTFLHFFLLFLYLIYRYLSRKNFYQRLCRSITDLDDALEQIENTPISNALAELLRSQYKVYQKWVLAEEKKQEEYHLFLDRWIHQMKTPVAVLRLMAEELDEPEASNLREEVDHLQTGLNMVLHMARVRTIEHDFQTRKIVLMDVIQSVNKENRRLYIRNQVYPKVEEEQRGIVVETDLKWLEFILSQLLENAVKFSQGKAKEVRIRLGQVEGRKYIEIRDYGVGIVKEDEKRIFHLFFTGENGRKFRESTGIGLYLVKQVLNYLGHEITVESTYGEGTTFRILF